MENVKVCPKCHREVPATDDICNCGYEFPASKGPGIQSSHFDSPAQGPSAVPMGDGPSLAEARVDPFAPVSVPVTGPNPSTMGAMGGPPVPGQAYTPPAPQPGMSQMPVTSKPKVTLLHKVLVGLGIAAYLAIRVLGGISRTSRTHFFHH